MLRFGRVSKQRDYGGPGKGCLALRFGEVSVVASFRPFRELFLGNVGVLLRGDRGILIMKLKGHRVATSSVNPGATRGVLTAQRVVNRFTRGVKLQNLGDITILMPGILKGANVRIRRVLGSVYRGARISAMVMVSTLYTGDRRELFGGIRVASDKVTPNSNMGGDHHRVDRGALGGEMVTVNIPAIVRFGRDHRGLVIAPGSYSLLASGVDRVLDQGLGLFLRDRVSHRVLFRLMWGHHFFGVVV